MSEYLVGSVEDGVVVVGECDTLAAILAGVQCVLQDARGGVVDMQRVVVAGCHQKVLGAVERQRVDAHVAVVLRVPGV